MQASGGTRAELEGEGVNTPLSKDSFQAIEIFRAGGNSTVNERNIALQSSKILPIRKIPQIGNEP